MAPNPNHSATPRNWKRQLAWERKIGSENLGICRWIFSNRRDFRSRTRPDSRHGKPFRPIKTWSRYCCRFCGNCLWSWLCQSLVLTYANKLKYWINQINWKRNDDCGFDLHSSRWKPSHHWRQTSGLPLRIFLEKNQTLKIFGFCWKINHPIPINGIHLLLGATSLPPDN